MGGVSAPVIDGRLVARSSEPAQGALFLRRRRPAIRGAMPDSIALPAIAFVAAGLIALALVWPQGQGARSPAPFGHPLAPIERTNTSAPINLATEALRGPEPAAAPRAAAHRR
jgi:hypothetical protein